MVASTKAITTDLKVKIQISCSSSMNWEKDERKDQEEGNIKGKFGAPYAGFALALMELADSECLVSVIHFSFSL